MDQLAPHSSLPQKEWMSETRTARCIRAERQAARSSSGIAARSGPVTAREPDIWNFAHDVREMKRFSESDSLSGLSKKGRIVYLDIITIGCPWEIVFSMNSEDTNRIHFVLLISRQGKVRLTKWYTPYQQKQRTKVIKEVSALVLDRGPKMCNFVDWQGYRVVYKRYASLYFCMCIDPTDNELETLQIIHHYVEILDRYFGNVCELDLIFNFHKAYFILDEVLIAGELQESNKKAVLRLVTAQDALVEAAKDQASSLSNIIAQATK